MPNTCMGPNVNPALQFRDAPAGTVSFVLAVEDIDAQPDPWTHWLVFNIPASTTEVAEAEIPANGTEGLANGGTHGYEGPCPRYFTGTHHYHFRLFALDTMLELSSSADKKTAYEAMQGHVLDEAVLVGLCEGAATTEAAA